ncbi:restriction endonuclease subunit S [Vibrio coralliilyticus]|uniref:restriction endonuclease subunit S n=1 Tax=Vibrio coralliilyticus TaxID=190893 RepID=UPI003916FCFD
MTEQMNVPKLRFSEFNEALARQTLEEVAEKIQDGTHFSPPLDEEGTCLYLTSKNIRNGFMLLEDISYISELEHKKIYKRCDVKRGDVLLTKDGASTGNCCINTLDSEFSLLSSVAFIRADANHHNDFIYQSIASQAGQKLIRGAISGQAITRITLTKLRNFKFYFPTLPEQQKIASFLSKVDEKIALLVKKKDKLTEYKKGVMQQLFNGKWEEQDGQLTFISPTLRFKADDGSEFPDWEEKKLGSLADLTSSKRVYLSDYSEDGVPFFRGKEISEIRKGIIPDDVLYITRKAFEEFKSKYGAPVEGDILVTAVGTLANIVRVTGEFEFYFKDGNLIWLRKPRCDSKFLSILMEANKHELLKTAIGSSQKALTIVELKKIVFKMPSLEEQQKITMFLSSLEEKVRLANSELEKAKEWKKGLLQQMFV